MSGDLTPNLYRILGLRPDSDIEKIRAAYRKLAKRFHPDVNVTDASAEQRTKAINRAYQVLGDPEARAAYDRGLERQRADARARFWKGVAAGVATFVLMVGLVSLATTLIPYSILPPVGTPQRVAPAHPGSVEANSNSGNSPSTKERATDELVTVSSLPPSYKSPIPPEALPTLEPMSQQPPEQRRGGQAADVPSLEVQTAAEARPRALAGVASPKDVRPESDEKMLPHAGLGDVTPPTRHSSAVSVPTVPFAKPVNWALYVNTNAGFALRYPADVFTLAGADVEDQERLLLSKDRRAVLRISSAPNNSAITLTEYRRLLMERRYAGAKIDYTLQQGNWFVLSGTAGEEAFYERITFSCDNRSIHGWLLVYPVRERPFYDFIVEEIDRSYRYLSPKGTSTVKSNKCASSESIRKRE